MGGSNLALKSITFQIPLQVMDLDDCARAKELFAQYSKEGIIYGCSFYDDFWNTTDERSNVGLSFILSKTLYAENYEEVFGFGVDDFIIYLKLFCIFHFYEYALQAFRDFLTSIRKMISVPVYQLDYTKPLRYSAMISDFIQSLPINNDTQDNKYLISIIEYMNDYLYEMNINSGTNQREMCSFDSYFLFNDLIERYWKSNIDIIDRLFYYPLYLWWRITGIIPLRPIEFLLTPRKCLSQKDGKYWLTLRRNIIKGSNKQIRHKIIFDYIDVVYEIPDSLAHEIEKYLNLTQKYVNNELETLFIADSHYAKFGQTKNKLSRYFSYVNMATVLRIYFYEILQDQYGYKVIRTLREDEKLGENQIEYIHLGDTRILSLVNIIAEGGSPVLAMSLAGHSDIEIGAHYYTNIHKLIKCRVYRQYRKALQGDMTYSLVLGRKPEHDDDTYIELENGDRCYSQKCKHNNYSDCEKACGPSGEIGYCPKCKEYRRNNETYFSSEDRYKRNINDSLDFLRLVVNLAHKQAGKPDDLVQAFLQVKSASYEYQEFCRERLLWEENNAES